jgi:hypothetical protein
LQLLGGKSADIKYMSEFLFTVLTPVVRCNSSYLQKLGETLIDFIDILPSQGIDSNHICNWIVCVDRKEIDLLELESILHRFSSKISVTIIPKKPNSLSTPGAARNKGLALARSPWLLTLDEDDFIEPLGLLKLFEAVTASPNIFWAAGKAFDVNPSGRFLREGPLSHMDPGFNFKGFFYSHRISKGYPPFSPSATIVRTDVVKRLGGWPESWTRTEDSALWCLIDLFYQGVWVPENVLAYRKHSSSVTHQPEYSRDTTDLMVKISEFILKKTTNPL